MRVAVCLQRYDNVIAGLIMWFTCLSTRRAQGLDTELCPTQTQTCLERVVFQE